MNNPKFMTTDQIALELIHNDRERELCAELASRIDFLVERRDWWQRNAEAIAKERGELFRAGEALQRIVQEKTYGCTEVAVWDQAAQPLRDMIATMPKP